MALSAKPTVSLPGCSSSARCRVAVGPHTARPALQAQRAPVRCFAGSVDEKGPDARLVKDIMTSGTMYSCSPDDTIDHALELLVTHRITGLPVLDGSGKVVGVVSDFDLLALDTLGRTNADNNLFPANDQTWKAFKEVKRMVAKTAGKKVGDVMTTSPITVAPDTCLNEATSILLTKKIRRLPVVDEKGQLLGLVSRGNIVKAALAARKAAAAAAL